MLWRTKANIIALVRHMHPELLHIEQEDRRNRWLALPNSRRKVSRSGKVTGRVLHPASRALLNRCTSARMPFTWTINPIAAASLPANIVMRATP